MIRKGHQNPEGRKKYNELNDCFEKVLKKESLLRVKQIAIASRNNQKSVWNYVKRNTTSSLIPPIPVPDNHKYFAHPQEKVQHVSDLFNKGFGDYRNHCGQIPISWMEYSAHMKSCPQVTSRGNEIRAALLKLDSTKAVGSSFVTYKLLKIAGVLVYLLTPCSTYA